MGFLLPSDKGCFHSQTLIFPKFLSACRVLAVLQQANMATLRSYLPRAADSKSPCPGPVLFLLHILSHNSADDSLSLPRWSKRPAVMASASPASQADRIKFLSLFSQCQNSDGCERHSFFSLGNANAKCITAGANPLTQSRARKKNMSRGSSDLSRQPVSHANNLLIKKEFFIPG